MWRLFSLGKAGGKWPSILNWPRPNPLQGRVNPPEDGSPHTPMHAVFLPILVVFFCPSAASVPVCSLELKKIVFCISQQIPKMCPKLCLYSPITREQTKFSALIQKDFLFETLFVKTNGRYESGQMQIGAPNTNAIFTFSIHEHVHKQVEKKNNNKTRRLHDSACGSDTLRVGWPWFVVLQKSALTLPSIHSRIFLAWNSCAELLIFHSWTLAVTLWNCNGIQCFFHCPIHFCVIPDFWGRRCACVIKQQQC